MLMTMADLYELLSPLLTCDTEPERKQSNTDSTAKAPPHSSNDRPTPTVSKPNKKTAEPKAKTKDKTKQNKTKQAISKTIKKQNKNKTASKKKQTQSDKKELCLEKESKPWIPAHPQIFTAPNSSKLQKSTFH